MVAEVPVHSGMALLPLGLWQSTISCQVWGAEETCLGTSQQPGNNKQKKEVPEFWYSLQGPTLPGTPHPKAPGQAFIQCMHLCRTLQILTKQLPAEFKRNWIINLFNCDTLPMTFIMDCCCGDFYDFYLNLFCFGFRSNLHYCFLLFCCLPLRPLE